jgi:O-acetyl-ADP-ribose deacetylase (regulator of RNase III)
MTLKIEVGDLFNETLNNDKTILVHGCNAQGVMGSGVAAIVKKLYPAAYNLYKNQKYSKRGLKVGDVTIAVQKDMPYVANAITQEFYGRDGKQYVNYDGVVEALNDVAAFAKERNLAVHLPMIGGGLGGGDTKRLTAIFQAVFHDVDATLWIQE